MKEGTAKCRKRVEYFRHAKFNTSNLYLKIRFNAVRFFATLTLIRMKNCFNSATVFSCCKNRLFEMDGSGKLFKSKANVCFKFDFSHAKLVHLLSLWG